MVYIRYNFDCISIIARTLRPFFIESIKYNHRIEFLFLNYLTRSTFITMPIEIIESMYWDFPNIITYYNTLHRMHVYDIYNGNDYFEAIVVNTIKHVKITAPNEPVIIIMINYKFF